MGNREKYNTCMRPYITGSKPKEERKLAFCIGAKICSGKAKDKAEAAHLCSLPKAPKVIKAKRMSATQKAKMDENCDVGNFRSVTDRFKEFYINVGSDRCAPCRELDNLIAQVETDIPHEILIIPGACTEILNLLEIDVFPTVIKMTKGKITGRYVGSPQEIVERMKAGV